jgi:Rieske Fe-S protein
VTSFALIILLLLTEMDFWMKKKNRRTFLRLVIGGIISLFIVSWNKLTERHIQLLRHKIKNFPFNKNKPVSFNENYIVVNQNQKTTVFSAHCTHLGCTIDKLENNRFLCPCHGSEYSLDGKVIKGPAYKDLEIIPSKISDDGSQIEVF